MARSAASQDAMIANRQERACLASSLPWTRVDLAWLTSLCLVTYACYLPVLHFDFVFDDRPFILQNPLLLSWRSVPRFFTAHLVSFLHPHAQGTYYRPGLLLWLLVQRKLWNLSPVGWHFSTLTLHVLAALSVYMLAREMFRRRFGAGVAALLFALHPVHAESAAWIMGLPDPLMTLLVVSSLIGYIHQRQSYGRSRKVWAAVSLLLYAAAILTKEVALTLPFILFAYEWIFPSDRAATGGAAGLARGFRNAVAPTWGYWGVTAAYLAARWAALGGLSHPLTALPGRMMVATWPLVLWSHLKLLVWPVGLSAFYDVPYTKQPGIGNFALPLAAVLACGVLVSYFAWKSPLAAFAGVWLFLPMALLLNLRVFPPGEIVHDRFVYFPSIGFVLLLGLGLDGFAASPRLPLSIRVRQMATVAALGVVLGAAAIYYCRFWANDWALYGRALAVAPGSRMANNNLAVDLADAGRYEEAIALEQQLLARDPDYSLAQYNLGYCQYKAGRFDDARRNLTRAVALSPAEPEPYLYLGLTNYRTGRLTEAVANFRRALEISPENARYRFTLGIVLRSQGDVTGARSEFASALALDPSLAAARDQLHEIDKLPAAR
jgi:protein O-mannosyl-transferase